MTADTVRITYAELARARGVSMAAARRLAQRHRWPKQVGNDGLSHVLVPTIYLVPSENDAGDVTTDVTGDVTTNAAADVPNGVAADSPELRSIPLEEALAAFADVANDIATRVANDVAGNVITILREQLTAERDRANRAEHRAAPAEDRAQTAEHRAQAAEDRTRETESRMRDLQEQLNTEMVEHRQIVAALTVRIPERRGWWRRRRLSRTN